MMTKKLIQDFLVTVCCALAVFLIAACDKEKKDDQQQTAAPQTFTIAYLPNEATEHNTDVRSGMAKALGEAIGMEVKEFQASDYASVIEAMRMGKVDMAYFGPLSFAMAYERAKAEPVAMKAHERDKNQATYKSVLIARTDNAKVNSIKDIKGRSIAFVDPASTSGNLVPSAAIMAAFPDEHLTMDALHTNGTFFSSVMFSGKHQAGLQAVLKGDVDIAPISDKILESEFAKGYADSTKIKIIYSSKPIPAEPMAVRGDLPADLKAKIKQFLITYDNADYFDKVLGNRDDRFIECTVEDYRDIIELNKQLNK